MSFTSKKDSMSSPWAKGTASPNHLTAASLLPIRPGNDQAIPNDTPAACIQHPKAYSFVWIPPDRFFFLLYFLSLSPSPLPKNNSGLFKKLKQKKLLSEGELSTTTKPSSCSREKKSPRLRDRKLYKNRKLCKTTNPKGYGSKIPGCRNTPLS